MSQMKFITRLGIFAFAFCFLVPLASGYQQQHITRHTADSLQHQLAQATTPQDSIAILFNLYDVNSASRAVNESRADNIEILDKLYDVAIRAKDTVTAFDALRYLSTVARYDTPFIEKQIKRLNRFPDSVEKRETETFLRIQKYFWALRDTTITDEELRNRYSQIRKEVAKSKGSKTLNDRLEQQFALVLYGSNIIESEQMDKYLTDLRGLVELAKDHRSQILSYYYRIAAMLYDENENPIKSNRADQKMIKLLRERDSLNLMEGRVFKNYDFQRFTTYRRMLGNYEHLPEDSIKIIYDELNVLMNRLPKHQINNVDKATVEAMWNMYRRKYPAALKDLRTVVTSKRFKNKPNFIKAYIRAASEVGSVEDLKSALDMYTQLMISRARDAADTEYARLKLEYQIDSLVTESKNAERQIREANRRQVEVASNYFNYAMIGLGLLLLSIIIIQIVANRRIKRIASQLRETNDTLLHERNALSKAKSELEQANAKVRVAMRQKSEFIHNVSHEISEPVKAIVGFSQLITDSIPEERRKYLTGFIDIISHNSTILQRIVGDILETAEVEDTVTNVMVTRFLPETVINAAADSFRPRLSDKQKIVVEPVKIIGNPPNGDIGIDTDETRLEQIINNLLDNAVKFAEKGTIRIESVINYDIKQLIIAISDEGHGIPPGKEEIIFERFEKLGHYNGGLGLGLYVSRALVQLLEGSIKVDTNYTRGTRMVITLPISIRSGMPV